MSTHLHFIGIGGSGISALAQWHLAQGKTVSGSDVEQNASTQNLKQQGIKVFQGHRSENLSPHTDQVIYTEAIDKSQNPEYLEAKKRGLPCQSYFEALGELSESKKTIAVAGTHGKTTTTAMLGQALVHAGLDPTVILGSRVPAFGNQNLKVGKSPWLVVEACEYRRSFLELKPFGLIVLNCEREHVDYYKTESDYLDAFKELIAQLPPQGFLIYNQEDANCQKIAQNSPAKTIGVSLKEAQNISLNLPGVFNQLNAAHALKAAEQMGAPRSLILDSLSVFSGTARRMETKGEAQGILIMDDYGHHPTEVNATLQALKTAHPQRRLICVFQAHQYSRTLELLEGFSSAFQSADLVILPNIFEARDRAADKAQMNVEKLCRAIALHQNQVQDGKGPKNTLAWLQKNTRPGDLVVTMGAGDVYKIGESFLASL